MLKAIKTQYNGNLFRSRLEARWAVFFDSIGWKYEYEHEGFVLKSGYYLPDFYFRQLDIYAEVKPTVLTLEELNRCQDLSLNMTVASGAIGVILLEGKPERSSYRTVVDGELGSNILFLGKKEKHYPFFSADYFESEWTMLATTSDAIKTANYYRFEHGEGLK